MANQEHLTLLKQGVEAWNAWRKQSSRLRPNLSAAHLSEADLDGADLSGTNLFGAHLMEAKLRKADLRKADLRKANLRGAHLWEADLIRADLSGADLGGANLSGANLSGVKLVEANLSDANLREALLSEADLTRANLTRAVLNRATLVETNFTGAILTSCRIYGISAWDVQLQDTVQSDLIISTFGQPTITVDNLEIAQFIYLVLNNTKLREAINILSMKAVLLLGRFTPGRKSVLEALRESLRQHNYLPIVFDFEKPTNRSYTETVRTLAHLARFVIADLTDPSSLPQELQAIVPTLAVPVQPLLLEGKKEYAMFVDLLKTYHWVLPIHYYRDENSLVVSLLDHVILPAEQKAQELEKLR